MKAEEVLDLNEKRAAKAWVSPNVQTVENSSAATAQVLDVNEKRAVGAWVSHNEKTAEDMQVATAAKEKLLVVMKVVEEFEAPQGVQRAGGLAAQATRVVLVMLVTTKAEER